MSEFITAKRRESYLSHASFTLPESLKRELLVAPVADSFLFNQPLLSTAIENMKEASLLSSTSSLASISKAALKSKPLGGPGSYQSPLDAPRAGPSGYRNGLLPHTVGVRSAVVAAGVRLLPQLEEGVFGGRSHAPVQPL